LVEGPSGILAVARPGEVVEWSFQRRRIVFASGAEATLFSGAHPDGLRGPEHDFAWCDELAKWAHPKAAFDNLMLGLRGSAGARPTIWRRPTISGRRWKRNFGGRGSAGRSWTAN
jgi:phage terminase large subunit-like protein